MVINKDNLIFGNEGTNLPSHLPFITIDKPLDIIKIRIGDVLIFNYKGKEKYVFVLNPDWKGKLHGLDLKFIDRRTLLNELVFDAGELVIKDHPHEFYKRVITQPNIQQTDSYRTYDRNMMVNVRRLNYRYPKLNKADINIAIAKETVELMNAPIQLPELKDLL